MVRKPHNAAVAIGSMEAAIPDAPREFVFSDADFRSLVALAREHAGIALSDSKRNLVYTRVSRRLRAPRGSRGGVSAAGSAAFLGGLPRRRGACSAVTAGSSGSLSRRNHSVAQRAPSAVFPSLIDNNISYDL